jgi:hypothetical protein
MNKLLADWHAGVAIDLSAERLAARDAAGNAVVGSLDGSRLLDLVALAFQVAVEEQGDWFRTAIKDHDNLFLLKGNDRETGLLAAACLWEVLDQATDLAVLAGYACVVGASRGWSCLLPDLSDRAEHRLREIGIGRRTIDAAPELARPILVPKAVATSFVEEWPDATDITGQHLVAALNKLAGIAQAGIDKLHSQIVRTVEWSDHAIDICAEESAYVGWLLCGSSKTLDSPWSSLRPNVAAVVAARELADLTFLLPAPPQADAFLDQLLAATAFTQDPQTLDSPSVEVPAPLSFLLADVDDGEEPSQLARRSFRQAMLIHAWAAVG